MKKNLTFYTPILLVLVLIIGLCSIHAIAQPGRRNVVGDIMPSSEELDDGRKSMIINDSEKSNMRGFIHLPTVRLSVANQRQSTQNIQGLTDYVNNFSPLKATMDAPISLDSREIMNYPFIYMVFPSGQVLTKLNAGEKSNMQKYNNSGGFLVIDVHDTQNLKNILGKEVSFRQVPIGHEIYNCFYNFILPDTKSTAQKRESEISLNRPINGIWIKNTLVGLSWAGGQAWSNQYKQEKSLKLGVNIIVYALMRYHKLL
jgi:hypothetical protein